MENKIAVFNNEEFGAVRTISENGKILFCAKDVAVALGYSNPRKAVADHCKGVTKRDTLTEGGVQSLSYIPETNYKKSSLKMKKVKKMRRP